MMPQVTQTLLRSDRDGWPLSVLRVSPDGAPCGVLQMAHGMAEHKERYLAMMNALAARGYVCVMNDHRGHGASLPTGEVHGYFGADGANALVDDLHQITQALRAEFPGLPLFLYGHSMGSLAVRAYRARYDADIDGLIVCGSPGWNPAQKAGRAFLRALSTVRGERAVSKLAANLVGGDFAKRFAHEGAEFAWLSTDRDAVHAYETDPLCGFPFTLNGYIALLDLMGMAYAVAPAHKPTLPVHFVSGSDDPCMPDPAGFAYAIDAMKRCGLTRVTSKSYPGMRHEIHNEPGRAEVFDDLANVLDAWRAGQA